MIEYCLWEVRDTYLPSRSELNTKGERQDANEDYKTNICYLVAAAAASARQGTTIQLAASN